MANKVEKPILVVVDDEVEELAVVEQELTRRYGEDYEIVAEQSATVALEQLGAFEEADRNVVLILADHWMPGLNGIDFLARARDLYPEAWRVVLIHWGDRSAGPAIREGIALNQIDYYLPKPLVSPDEQFHRVITGILADWARLHHVGSEVVRVVGERWSPRSHEFRDLLDRNGIPYGFYEVDSPEGQRFLEEAGCPTGPFPVAILRDGSALRNPSNVEMAEAVGASTHPEPEYYDMVIIGAGPAGLSAAVYGASEGLRTMVIEREAIGGQAGTSTLIRNYLGFPRGITGAELASRAYQQAWLFNAQFNFMQEVVGLRCEGEQRIVTLTDGSEIAGRTIVLAMGARYRRLEVPGLEALTGRGVYYSSVTSEALALEGRNVFVVGGGNSAGQAAVHLANYCARVTLLVRDETLTDTMSEYLITEIEATGNILVQPNTEVVEGHGQHHLESLTVRDRETGETENVPAAALFVLIGSQPRSDWLPESIWRDEQGFILTGRVLMVEEKQRRERWPLERGPFLLETSVPGVFAAGDIRHRSVKRVASAVGEGSIAVQVIHRYLNGR